MLLSEKREKKKQRFFFHLFMHRTYVLIFFLLFFSCIISKLHYCVRCHWIGIGETMNHFNTQVSIGWIGVIENEIDEKKFPTCDMRALRISTSTHSNGNDRLECDWEKSSIATIRSYRVLQTRQLIAIGIRNCINRMNPHERWAVFGHSLGSNRLDSNDNLSQLNILGFPFDCTQSESGFSAVDYAQWQTKRFGGLLMQFAIQGCR